MARLRPDRPPRPPFRGDDRGVSVVIGGILVTAILVSTLVTVRVAYVPIWEQDAEALHAHAVERDLAALKAEVDRLAGNRSAGTISNPVALGRSSPSAFLGDAPPGEIRYRAGGRDLVLSSPRLLVIEQNGTTVAGVGETYVDPGGAGGGSVENVSGVRSFRFKIDSISASQHGRHLAVELDDDTGAFAGDLRVRVERIVGDDGDGYRVILRARDAALNVLFEQPIYVASPGEDSTPGPVAPFWIDVLDPEYRFDRVLGLAPAPFRLTFTETTLPGDYAITYETSASSGGRRVVQGGGGTTYTGFERTYAGGSITCRATHHRLPWQAWTLEHGALVLNQSAGRLFKVAPGFDAALVGNVTRLEVTLPSLTGPTSGAAGRGVVSVTTTAVAHADLVANAPRVTLDLTTEFPELWAAFWRERLGALAGFDEGEEYLVTTAATRATLTVYGTTPQPASNYYDVFLELRQSTIEVRVQP